VSLGQHPFDLGTVTLAESKCGLGIVVRRELAQAGSRPLPGSEHGSAKADRPGAENGDVPAFEPAAGTFDQRALGQGDDARRGRIGSIRIRKHPDAEIAHHRLFCGLEHVGRQMDIAPADENARVVETPGRTAEDRVLHQRGDVLGANARQRNHLVEARIGGHRDIEGTYVGARDQEIEDFLRHSTCSATVSSPSAP
jgi:hypothetical protein